MKTDSTLDNVPVAERQTSADGDKSQRQVTDPDALSHNGNIEKEKITQEEQQYITGFKFAIVMVSLTMVFFLVMLDLSIITTVSISSVRRQDNRSGFD